MTTQIRQTIRLPEITEGKVSQFHINIIVESVRVIDDLGFMSKDAQEFFETEREQLKNSLKAIIE